MPKLTPEDIRKRFECAKEFNEIFDAFEQAIEQCIDDIELYRKLFWNNALTPDELRLFGEKLVKEFPHTTYDVYMWLASVFEATYSMFDNYTLTLEYYRKAAVTRPTELDPYLDAADCYEPDLNIPPILQLIAFLKSGTESVSFRKPLYQRLAHLYQLAGNDEMHMYYERKAGEESEPGEQIPPPPSPAT